MASDKGTNMKFIALILLLCHMIPVKAAPESEEKASTRLLGGLTLGVDYGMTLSCYDPSPEDEACGFCDACLLRLKGFAESGLSDPAPYRAQSTALA